MAERFKIFGKYIVPKENNPFPYVSKSYCTAYLSIYGMNKKIV